MRDGLVDNPRPVIILNLTSVLLLAGESWGMESRLKRSGERNDSRVRLIVGNLLSNPLPAIVLSPSGVLLSI